MLKLSKQRRIIIPLSDTMDRFFLGYLFPILITSPISWVMIIRKVMSLIVFLPPTPIRLFLARLLISRVLGEGIIQISNLLSSNAILGFP